MECLDIDVLCQYLDDELDVRLQERVAEHLAACQGCADRLRRLREHDAMLKTLPAAPTAPEPTTVDCCNAEELSAYVSEALTAAQAQRIEQHLETCDRCLREVMGMHQTQRLLTPDALASPPDYLVATVRQGFATAQPATAVERLGTLVVQVAADGLTFVQALLVPGHVGLTIGGHTLPATAFRSLQTGSAAMTLLDMQQTVGDVRLHLRILHEERETVLLHVYVQKAGVPLARQRVSLSSLGRMIDARTTSAGGEVEFPRLTIGDYTLSLPEERLATRLVLRSASETS